MFSFFTLVDAGSAQDPLHQTGLAHVMEHMAFRARPTSAPRITRPRSLRWRRSSRRTPRMKPSASSASGRLPQKLAQLKQAWQDAIKDADQYVIKNQFGEVIECHGGVGVIGFTNYDETAYMYSLLVDTGSSCGRRWSRTACSIP